MYVSVCPWLLYSLEYFLLQLSNSEWLSSVMTKIQELGKKKSYLRELCARAIVDILTVVRLYNFIFI